MSTIFISHSSRDNEIAQELARRLAEQNHASVFLDLDPEKGIVAGQSWERTLYRKLRGCRAVIALCTDHYLASHWCFAEIALARMEGKHIFALQVDPLGPDARMPAILTTSQYLDLRTNPEEGYRRLWRGLKEEDILGVAGEWDPSRPPYVGLDAFQEEHAPVFFGREDETRAGIELLGRGAPGLVMVVGASGSGKSSMVRAGMLPRLRSDTHRWIVVDPLRPGRDPFGELAVSLEAAFRRYTPEDRAGAASWTGIRERLVAASDELTEWHPTTPTPAESTDTESATPADERLSRLIEQLEELRERPPDRAGERLRDFLEWSIDDLRRIDRGLRPMRTAEDEPTRDGTALVEIADRLRRLIPDRRDAHVLLIVDQFEELLGHDKIDHPANRFLALLRASLEVEHSPIMALGTMRSDFLGVFQRNQALRGIDFETLSVGSMPVEGMRRVIEEPARLGAIEIEPGLPDRLLEDAETPDALPLLSFTLWKLWREHGRDGSLELAEYEQLGGLHGAIASEADAVMAEAKREGRGEAVRAAFLRMARVTEDGGYARQPVRWDDEALQPVHSFLERFIDRRLLRSRAEGEARMVEVTHEALFRSWAPLRRWLDHHRSELMLMAQIRRDAAMWVQGDRSPDALWRGGRLQHAAELREKRPLHPVEEEFVQAGVRERQRRVWRIRIGVSAVIAALTTAAIFAFVQMRVAYREKALAHDLARVAVASQRLLDDANQAALILVEVENPEQTAFAPLKMREALNAGLSIVLDGGEAAIEVAAFSPDGSRVATGNAFGRARVWNADGTGSPVVFDEHTDAITALAFSPDGGRILTTSRDGTARVWDATTGAAVADPVVPGDGAEVHAGAFSGDGRRIAVASKEVTVRSTEGSGEPTVFTGHGDNTVWSVAFSGDGGRVVTAAEDGTARVWNASGAPEQVVLRGHTDRVTVAAFSPDDASVVTTSYDGTARVWSADGSGRPVVLAGHGGAVLTGAFSPDGSRVVTASIDGTARVWMADGTGEPVILAGYQDSVVSAAFSPDGDRVVTASSDGTARVWHADGSGEPIVLVGHGGPLSVATFDGAGARVLTASQDGTARVWHADGRSDPVVVRRLEGPDTLFQAAAFSSDGSRLAAVTVLPRRRHQVTVWPLDGDGDSTVIKLSGPPVTAVRFSPDSRHVITSDEGGGARISNTGARDAEFEAPWGNASVRATAISPDGASAATASRDGAVRLWQTDQASESADTTALGEHRNVSAVAFSSDGNRVATTSRDGTIKLWDVARRSESSIFGDTAGPTLVGVTYGPGGGLLLTISADSSAQLWDASSGDSFAIYEGHGGALTSATFSPDGSRILTASLDGTARIWDVGGAIMPIILTADDRPILAAVFSPDARSVLTLSEDGTLRRWATITYETLRQSLADATNQCLETHFRQEYLGESEEVARVSHLACEREQRRIP